MKGKERAETIKINHLDYGHVIFSKMSSRQMDILENYAEIKEAVKKYPNDHELGKEIRRLLKS